MQKLADKLGIDLIPIKENTLAEVTILAKSRNKILVDVGGITLGFIPEKEFSSDIAELKPKDKILAYVLSVENDDGFVVLSLKRAEKDRLMKNLDEKFQKKEELIVHIKQANRGGLMVDYGNIEGFLPVSQLASNHYPKVGDDREKILSKLNELVGEDLKVKVINFDKAYNKLIFSEKAATNDLVEKKIKDLNIGQKLNGKVTGVADFGIFVDVDGIEGLVHISEISWERINDLKKLYKIGDEVNVEVISVENSKVSLSIKRLQPDPWLKLVKDYKKGQITEGKITRLTPFGAFVELPKKVSGLVHISELEDELKKVKSSKIEDVLIFGNSYKFEIISIEPETHKINLTIAKNKSIKEKKEVKVKTPAKKVAKKKSEKK